MRYWWVNQSQTHEHEVRDGFLWSPKRRSNNTRNPFYENMKEVAPGDVVFGYWDGLVRAHGVVQSYGYDAPKPLAFKREWGTVGYRADVRFTALAKAVRPRDEWARIQPLLPEKYSPLQRDSGKGLQQVYLAALSNALGALLVALVTSAGNLRVADARPSATGSRARIERDAWETREQKVLLETALTDTERDALIRARRGQGRFRDNVSRVERACRITGVDNPNYLIASHIKPWRVADNAERLDEHNGLMLSATADFLFDRGFISFGDGHVLVSQVADVPSLLKLGIDPERPPFVGGFSDKQDSFLEFHRTQIFLKAM